MFFQICIANDKKAQLDMKAFEPLNHQIWPKTQQSIMTYQPGNIEALSKMFSIDYTQDLQKEFNDLVTLILKNSYDTTPLENSPFRGERHKYEFNLNIDNDQFWCNQNKDDPALFWTWIANKFPMSLQLKLLIRRVITVPMGSGIALHI